MLDTLDWLNGTRAIPAPIDTEMLYSMFWPAFCDRYGARVTADMKRVGDAYMGKIKAWSEMRPGPRCLTHGDFRPDNMLFDLADEGKPIVVVDWQTVGVGSGVSDIAYYLGTALDPAHRKAEEASLFAHYREKLEAHGVSDTADLWDSCRGGAFSGFLMGATAAMVVQQTDRGDNMFLTMCGRSAAMVLDHADIALPG